MQEVSASVPQVFILIISSGVFLHLSKHGQWGDDAFSNHTQNVCGVLCRVLKVGPILFLLPKQYHHQ